MAPIFQPRFYEDAYPIGRVVQARARALGLSRTDLVRRLGFASLQNGHARLTALLMAGSAPPAVTANLAEALEVEQSLIDAVLLATEQQRHDEARARILDWEREYRCSFRPHLQIQTERKIPSPIFVAALIGTARLRIISLADDALSADVETRDRAVKAVIVAHYRERAGRVPAFGRITEYVLVTQCGYNRVDFGLPFNLSGDPAGPMRKVPRLPDATLGTKLGDTRLTGLLRSTEIRTLQFGDTP
jgi:hypothetical protein